MKRLLNHIDDFALAAGVVLISYAVGAQFGSNYGLGALGILLLAYGLLLVKG